MRKLHYEPARRSILPVSNQEGEMSDIVILVSRILMSAVFILYGSLKFMDVTSIISNPGTKRFMDLVASGAAAPTWLGYLIAAIELMGGALRSLLHQRARLTLLWSEVLENFPEDLVPPAGREAAAPADPGAGERLGCES